MVRSTGRGNNLANRQRPRAADKIAELEDESRRLARLESELSAGDPALLSLPAGSPDYHRRLAMRLAGLGEAAAARGHLLKALERESGGSPR